MIYCICSPFLAGLEDTAAQTVAGQLPGDKFEEVFPSRFDPFTFVASLNLHVMIDIFLHIDINLKKAGAGGERLKSWRQSKGGELSQVAGCNLYQFKTD